MCSRQNSFQTVLVRGEVLGSIPINSITLSKCFVHNVALEENKKDIFSLSLEMVFSMNASFPKGLLRREGPFYDLFFLHETTPNKLISSEKEQ